MTKFFDRFKVYHLLWAGIPCLFLFTLFRKTSFIDLQLHDTYFVFAYSQLVVAATLLLALLGAIYWLLRNYRFNTTLARLHGFLTLLGVFILLGGSSHESMSGENGAGYVWSSGSYHIWVWLLFLLVQLFFVINMLVGLLRGKRKRVDV